MKPLSPLRCAVAGRVSPSTLACPPVDSGSPTPPTSPAPPPTPGTVAAEEPRLQPTQLCGLHAAWTPVCGSRPAVKIPPVASGLQTGPPVRRSVSVCLHCRRTEPSSPPPLLLLHTLNTDGLRRCFSADRPVTWFVGDLSHGNKHFHLKTQCE